MLGAISHGSGTKANDRYYGLTVLLRVLAADGETRDYNSGDVQSESGMIMRNLRMRISIRITTESCVRTIGHRSSCTQEGRRWMGGKD